ncbi:hypothetical protein SAMN05216326_12923 [Nitrosomonas marina]|uniref:Polysaccharide deacetylase n=1 Tax=Nitrosomonas marina TaxID=917 RepID=A0A1I0ENV0_9PROT|nr:polysaccharide deacetylase [Nitrosomonas marina]SET46942.1 hypothetical protein SAMN05216326_12923 [Nitrosomonas marina]
MLNVYFTVDVEIWCGGWQDLDSKFPSAFKQYIYGHTPDGDFGLPYKLKILNDYGLKGVFFVEPMFSCRFGRDPLEEIVNLIKEANQTIELHLHTEWIDEARQPIFPSVTQKRQFLRYFTLEEQTRLIALGKQWLNESGVDQIRAFRAGSFGFNVDTLSALIANDIAVDSSYNASFMGPESNFMPGTVVTEAVRYKNIYEVPMTVYFDRPGHLRHTQLCACSFKELEGLLWKALEQGWQNFTILSHNFELLHRSFERPDKIVIQRFIQLCEFLEKNKDCFRTSDYSDFQGIVFEKQPTPLISPLWRTGQRMLEQVWSKYA